MWGSRGDPHGSPLGAEVIVRASTRAAVIGTMVMLAACTGDGSKAPPRPVRFESADCPSEIRTVTLFHVSCGYLEVPQDRSTPGGPTARVFVSRWEPKAKTVAPIPVLYLGDDIAYSFDYVSLNGMVDHLVDRVVYAMEPRGTGQSQPNLSCPEVDALAEQVLSVPSDDAGARSAFLAAVATCRDRIVSQGIDPVDFSLEASAADAEDLRTALGIDRWDLLTKGTSSRIAAEYLREFGAHAHAAFFSQVELPGMDPLELSVDGTQQALAALGSACADDPRCGRTFPAFEADVSALVDRLRAQPVSVEVDGGSVLFDGAMLLRDFRTALSQIPDNQLGDGTRLHLVLEGAAHDPGRGLRPFAAGSRAAGTYCDGYLARCPVGLGFASGVYLSVLCRDIVPFIDTGELNGLTGADASWEEAFSDQPWMMACGRWNVPSAATAVGSPISSDVPVYLAVGTFDPFDPRSAVVAAARGLSDLQVSERPQGHRSFSADCLSDVRQSFFSDPHAGSDESCVRSLRVRFSFARR
jgi:pimeloyl-ACP methyl ester carboxylesterase